MQSFENRFTDYPNKLLNAAFAFAGRPFVEELAGGADLVYLPNLNFFTTRKPYVATVHDLSFVHYPDFFSKKQRLWHSLVRPERTLRQAARVVAVSEHTKADVSATYGISPEKISVVHPGVEERYFNVSREEIARVTRKYNLTKKFFLFLGTLEPRKNVSSIVAAFEKLTASGMKLVIAGGRGWLDDAIFTRAKNSPRWSDIIFLDYVRDEDKPGLYAAATAFVYPSFYEGFGMPVLEAMAAGTPVIASHASSLGEVVGDAGLLINPYDVSELAEAMTTIVADSSLRTTFITRGCERANKFSWAESARKLEKVFDSVK